MTFKETDFPSIIKFLKSFIKEDTDPQLVKDVLLQLIKMYEDVPLYPGIASMCMGTLVKKIAPTEAALDQKIYISNKGDSYHGIVATKNSEGLVLKSVKTISSEEEIELEFREMDRVEIINDKILKELWPSLVFEKDKKR